ncbi:cyclin-like protein [Desarmillaria tabescens]|uniref:Cyclin-like protein n=1 Tax=Armillaria tabescens TaxID=1929756 RepID=A0AA39NGY6_ARMTA|nr:cyclin-like protein [Desarmillaria tabescens]KAK0465425.1 cyclin-like protein [Desarmillaria tabescens]
MSNVSPPATKKSIYEGSTQFKNWRYSPEKLAQVRSTLNQAAVAVIKRTFEAYEPGSSANVLFLTADEEHLLVKHYISTITQLCGLFRFPEEVEATAISYFKRFYLKNTVMDWHPKNVMLTTLFLATKTTNNPISLETYTTHIKSTTASDVLDLEFLVAQSLGFEFSVWHAHRALWGIWLDFQLFEFIYTPSQIALAAMSLALPEESYKWLKSKHPSSDAVEATVNKVKIIIQRSSRPPDVESVREVDRRLRLCKNPEKVVGSKAYLARKAEQEKKAEEKRNRKAAEAGEDIDPFGIELGRPNAVDDDDDDDD